MDITTHYQQKAGRVAMDGVAFTNARIPAPPLDSVGQILMNELFQSAGDLQSSLIRAWYNLIVLLLFDLSNVVQLSKVGPVSPIACNSATFSS